MKRLEDSYDSNGNLIDQFDDSFPRDVVSRAINQHYGGNYKSNNVMFAIDITSEDDPKTLYEIEYGKTWFGNRWPIRPPYQDLFGKGRNTINLEDRKWYIWGLYARLRPENDKKIEFYLGYKIHYVRINADYNQIVIVPDDVIRDSSKRHLVENVRVDNVKYDEDFFYFFEDDCITLNLQLDGNWVDSRELNGKFQPTMSRGAQMFRDLKNKK
jgi:hypothetical protein